MTGLCVKCGQERELYPYTVFRSDRNDRGGRLMPIQVCGLCLPEARDEKVINVGPRRVRAVEEPEEAQPEAVEGEDEVKELDFETRAA